MLKSLQIKNFTVFQDAQLEFSQGLTVITGENGTGKSHLLKLGYVLLRTVASLGGKPARTVAERALARELVEVFCPPRLGDLVSHGHSLARVAASWDDTGALSLSFSPRKIEKVDIHEACYSPLPAPALLVPPGEILSVFGGLQGALETRELDFSATYLHVARALNRAPLKTLSPAFASILQDLETAIGACVVQRENRFYLVSKGRKKARATVLPATLAAEGHRRLGLLAYLVKNGELGEGTQLFCDAPETGLSPRLLRTFAHILARLAEHTQIVLATRSPLLLQELDLLQQQKRLEHVRYLTLQPSASGTKVLQGTADMGDTAF